MAGIPFSGKGNVVVTTATVPNKIAPQIAKGSAKGTTMRPPSK